MHLFHKDHHDQDSKMSIEPAAANRSLSTIRTELEFLRDSGLLRPEQYQSIMSQLPVRTNLPSFHTLIPKHRVLKETMQQPGGIQSTYVDPRYAQGQNYVNMPQLAQAAQDPNHPANPQHPKVSSTSVETNARRR